MSGLIEVMQGNAAAQAVRDRPAYLRDLLAEHAINGDESFAQDVVTDLYLRVAHNKLEVSDRAALCAILSRIDQNDAGKRIICGVEGRPGQSRRGRLGLHVAMEVSRCLVEGQTAEAAWDSVGEKMHLTSSAVKQYWMRWKPKFIASVRAMLLSRHGFPQGTTEAEIDAYARYMALGRRGLNAKEWPVVERVMRRATMIDGQSPGTND